MKTYSHTAMDRILSPWNAYMKGFTSNVTAFGDKAIEGDEG